MRTVLGWRFLNRGMGRDALQMWTGFVYGGTKQTVGEKLSGLLCRLACHCLSRTHDLPCSFVNLKKKKNSLRKYSTSPVCFLLKAVLWDSNPRTCISLFSSSEEWCWVQLGSCRLDTKVSCLKKHPIFKWGKNPGIFRERFFWRREEKTMENNEFIKLKMHEAAKRSGFNTWQMERELPLLSRCTDTALLIAWSCLGDTKSSQAMTWWEQGARGLL